MARTDPLKTGHLDGPKMARLKREGLPIPGYERVAASAELAATFSVLTYNSGNYSGIVPEKWTNGKHVEL